MTRHVRFALSWLLVVVFVLTGQAMAVARGMPGAAGYAEYCIGESAILIAVDAEGNPTGESHICPDVSLTLLNMVSVGAVVIPVPVFRTVTLELPRETAAPVIRTYKGAARAPPVLS
ncbi:hypothetical protein [Shimia haliotis]|nr:hypothetical protein [Shimia haliotis]